MCTCFMSAPFMFQAGLYAFHGRNLLFNFPGLIDLDSENTQQIIIV